MGLLPKTLSTVSFRPANEMLYPPNAGFPAIIIRTPCALRTLYGRRESKRVFNAGPFQRENALVERGM